MGRGVLLYDKKKIFANHKDGDYMIVIFGVSGLEVFRRGHII
jgi:hypothetical protein